MAWRIGGKRVDAKRPITTRGVSEGQRWQPGILPGARSTPFVPQGRAPRRLKHSRQGLRGLATLSLAYATGCDGSSHEAGCEASTVLSDFPPRSLRLNGSPPLPKA